MPAPALRLEYANTLSDAIGRKHGITVAQLQKLQPRVKTLVTQTERERKHGQHRYRDLPHDAAMVKAVQAAVRRYRSRADNLVVLGIGGSALGNIALQTALNPPLYNSLDAKQRRGPRLYVMDNVDPVQIANLIDVLGPRLKRTVFNVISKSGETAETAAQFLLFRDLLVKKIGRKALVENMVVTTDPEAGTMRNLCDTEGYYTLPVPPGVGGRFSVLSAVGLFSAAMCGVDIKKLLAGAAAMGERVGSTSRTKNPAAMLAALLYLFHQRGKTLHVMFPYSHQLKDLSDWYCQLWAESLGKSRTLDGKRVDEGATPIKALGATDQHSQVQLYREGPHDKVFIFLAVDKFATDLKIPRAAETPAALKYLQGKSFSKLINAERAATEYALVASNRPCLTIRFPKITEETVGQFIMLWEATTTLMGGLLNINPYDQPAVQLGKDFTYALMGKAGFADQRATFNRYAASLGDKAAV